MRSWRNVCVTLMDWVRRPYKVPRLCTAPRRPSSYPPTTQVCMNGMSRAPRHRIARKRDLGGISTAWALAGTHYFPYGTKMFKWLKLVPPACEILSSRFAEEPSSRPKYPEQRSQGSHKLISRDKPNVRVHDTSVSGLFREASREWT